MHIQSNHTLQASSVCLACYFVLPVSYPSLFHLYYSSCTPPRKLRRFISSCSILFFVIVTFLYAISLFTSSGVLNNDLWMIFFKYSFKSFSMSDGTNFNLQIQFISICYLQFLLNIICTIFINI